MAYKLIFSFRLLPVCFSTIQTAPKVMQNRRAPPFFIYFLSELKITISKINSRGGHCSYPKLQKSQWTAQTAQSRFEIFAKEYSASGITKKENPGLTYMCNASSCWPYGRLRFYTLRVHWLSTYRSWSVPLVAFGSGHSATTLTNWPIFLVTDKAPSCHVHPSDASHPL